MSKFVVLKREDIPSYKEETVIDTTCLSPEQQLAYDKFVKGENIFVTGPGGTGKTKLVQYLVEYSRSLNRNVPVCAMTGCAAVLLGCKARTISRTVTQ